MDDDALETAARALIDPWPDAAGYPPDFDLRDIALDQASYPYNWRGYVPPLVARVWPYLTRRERILVLLLAYQTARDVVDRLD